MKTAVSLPDEVFEAAEKMAEERGISRSRLYATAIAQYVALNRKDDITDRLNALYADVDSALDPDLEEMQCHSVSREDW